MTEAQTKSDSTSNTAGPRDRIAIWILVISGALIAILAVLAILGDTDPKEIFNSVLPVAASWVGTVLAFYFGRENFEAANKQVRDMIDRLTPEERAQAKVTSIMRKPAQTTVHKHASGKDDTSVDVKTLRANFSPSVSRLPVLGADEVARFMLHSSTLDSYLLAGGQETDTLAQMIASEKTKGREYGPGKGFVVVGESTTIADAKQTMQAVQGCQDIFVTKGGSDKEPLTGWISNTRLSKFLQ